MSTVDEMERWDLLGFQEASSAADAGALRVVQRAHRVVHGGGEGHRYSPFVVGHADSVYCIAMTLTGESFVTLTIENGWRASSAHLRRGSR